MKYLLLRIEKNESSTDVVLPKVLDSTDLTEKEYQTLLSITKKKVNPKHFSEVTYDNPDRMILIVSNCLVSVVDKAYVRLISKRT